MLWWYGANRDVCVCVCVRTVKMKLEKKTTAAHVFSIYVWFILNYTRWRKTLFGCWMENELAIACMENEPFFRCPSSEFVVTGEWSERYLKKIPIAIEPIDLMKCENMRSLEWAKRLSLYILNDGQFDTIGSMCYCTIICNNISFDCLCKSMWLFEIEMFPFVPNAICYRMWNGTLIQPPNV